MKQEKSASVELPEVAHWWRLGAERAPTGVLKIKNSLLVFFSDAGVPQVWIAKDLFKFIEDAVVEEAAEKHPPPEFERQPETFYPQNYWVLSPPEEVEDLPGAIFGADGAPCNPDIGG